MKLEGRNAIITGASQGLGQTIARHFVAEGASVLLCARDIRRLGTVREELAGGAHPQQRIAIMKADISKEEEVRGFVAKAMEEFGRIDILVNNAGVYGPKGTIEDIDWSSWVEAIEINLMGTVLACKYVLPHMKKKRLRKDNQPFRWGRHGAITQDQRVCRLQGRSGAFHRNGCGGVPGRRD